jgi:hypothetical protein
MVVLQAIGRLSEVGLFDRRADGDRPAPYLSPTRCVEIMNKQTIEPPYEALPMGWTNFIDYFEMVA